ncbi:MAG: L-glutamate gamma-semialdehyde dehydrogenase [Myxococcales bacterium]
MNNAVFSLEVPRNEPLETYAPATPGRAALEAELERQSREQIEIPLIIGGKEVRTGKVGKVVMPCEHGHVLATYHQAGEQEVLQAIDAALRAQRAWERLSWVERASITLKAAELLSTRYRYRINAATMLGQGKSAHQAEIDSACETIDFLRFNAHFASRIYSEQPHSSADQLNRIEFRPLEGFVFALTPFNFTAIASNLNMSVVLMGNTTVWKPSTTALLSNYHLMNVFQEAGLPDGVINFVPGSGPVVAGPVLSHPSLAGVHFTGSTATFNGIWRAIAKNLDTLRTYPRLVGETGGKDFVFVHASADPLEVATGLVRGAFEYQGQKCSAASRAYLPRSLWPRVRDLMREQLASIRMGDVRDFGNFVNAVIDEKSFDSIMGYIERAKAVPGTEIVAGGKGDKSVGYFIEPTVIQTQDPKSVTMEEEIFGPVLTVYVYPDEQYAETLEVCDQSSPYGLTGAIFARDRYAIVQATEALRNAAGNFYINDKPTGAVVGMQPFGGSRASGTNDKAGGPFNLQRWVSPRTIKETFAPACDYRYPFLAKS